MQYTWRSAWGQAVANARIAVEKLSLKIDMDCMQTNFNWNSPLWIWTNRKLIHQLRKKWVCFVFFFVFNFHFCSPDRLNNKKRSKKEKKKQRTNPLDGQTVILINVCLCSCNMHVNETRASFQLAVLVDIMLFINIVIFFSFLQKCNDVKYLYWMSIIL